MSELEPPPSDLHGLFEAERAAPRVGPNERVALRARLAASFIHEAPFAEPRVANERTDELARATAQEPVAAPPVIGRAKGKKMNLFDKRVIGSATLTAAAIGLLGIVLYKRPVDGPAHDRIAPSHDGQGPMVELGHSLETRPRFLPVAPTTGADLAMTAGENVWIHVPVGAVDIEIQSKCNAERKLSVVTQVLMRHGQRGDPSSLETKSTGKLVVGIDTPDGRASTYHLTPGADLTVSMYEYTSQCVGQPPLRGNVVLDRIDITDPIGPFTNARVYHNAMAREEHLHVFGTVLPGATVSIGATSLALRPADPSGADLPIYSAFATDVLGSEAAAAVRVDDANGTHFYVVRSR